MTETTGMQSHQNNDALIMQLIEEQKTKLLENAYNQKEVDLVRDGDKIVLPAIPTPMSERKAIEVLKDKIKMNEEEVGIHETVDCFPLEGAWALMQVLKVKYGWARPVPEPGFFGPKPPVMASFHIGPKEIVQVIWGKFMIPGLEAQLKTGATHEDGRAKFVMAGECKLKDKNEVKAIAAAVRQYVKEHSVYKGKAIRIKSNDGEVNYDEHPRFMDLSKVNEEELTFSDHVRSQIETSLFTPVEKTELCRKHKIPLKRGVLLEGPYGTGKTLTALVQAKKCVENGWTYIYLDSVDALRDAVLFARNYAPAVIFAEDIDRVLEDRDMSVDQILNNIDGVDSKDQELMVVLTTNFVQNIDKAMLRPGRLDAVISVEPPDAKAAEKLMRVYSQNLIPKDEDLTEAGKELSGQIPAVIREVVERSKLYAIGKLEDGEELTLTGKSLADAARGMKNHIALMQHKEEEMSEAEKLASSMASVVKSAFNGSAESIRKTQGLTEDIHRRVM